MIGVFRGLLFTAFCALAGIGLATVIGWLPAPLGGLTLGAIGFVFVVWATRELRWLRQTEREVHEFERATRQLRQQEREIDGLERLYRSRPL